MTTASLDSGLGYLMACYFHQDWRCDAETWQDVIAEFVQEEPSVASLVEAMGEISLVLVTTLADDDPTYLYRVFLCEYVPLDGATYREWLAAVRTSIADESYARGRVPGTALDDLLLRLDRVGIERSSDDPDEWRSVAGLFGESATVEEVTALLGAISFVLAPTAPTGSQLRTWLDDVRAAIAIPAAERWPPTSHGADGA